MISHSEGNLKSNASLVIIPVLLLKALCQTEFFTDLGLTKHFFDKENKDMAKLINQVWALTPFYSFNFEQSMMSNKVCFDLCHTIKVCVSCFFKVL